MNTLTFYFENRCKEPLGAFFNSVFPLALHADPLIHFRSYFID